jgi:hemoglobin
MSEIAAAGTLKIQPPLASPYELLGGGPVIASIVARFYDLVDQDPAYANLRAMHAQDLRPVRESLIGFLTAWTGGPRDWFAGPRSACMMTLHSRFAIPALVAEEWSDAMRTAIAGEGALAPELARSLAAALDRMAKAMVNRPH